AGAVGHAPTGASQMAGGSQTWIAGLDVTRPDSPVSDYDLTTRFQDIVHGPECGILADIAGNLDITVAVGNGHHLLGLDRAVLDPGTLASSGICYWRPFDSGGPGETGSGAFVRLLDPGRVPAVPDTEKAAFACTQQQHL